MASNLGIKFEVSGVQGCGSINFVDTTGIYNALTNPGGYGTPNPSYGDVMHTEIEITLSDDRVITIISYLPDADETPVNINAHTLGYTDNIPDQIINVVYRVFGYGDELLGMKESQILLDCNTLACLESKSCLAIGTICAPCVDEEAASRAILDMWIEYTLIRNAADIDDFTCLDGAIEALYKKCSKGCTPC